MATMAKLHFELLPHPPYSLDLTPSDYNLFAGLKRRLQGKRFDSNEEVIAETEAYFEAIVQSFSKNASKCYRSVGMNVSLLKETRYCYFFQKYNKF